MQKFEDLREVLTAIQDIGNAWHEENISLRAENFRLRDENKSLRTENNSLREQNENLRREIQNLSDEIKNLESKLQSLRDELIKQLDVDKQDSQKFIRKFFGGNVSSVATQTDTPSISTTTPTTSQNINEAYSNPYT